MKQSRIQTRSNCFPQDFFSESQLETRVQSQSSLLRSSQKIRQNANSLMQSQIIPPLDLYKQRKEQASQRTRLHLLSAGDSTDTQQQCISAEQRRSFIMQFEKEKTINNQAANSTKKKLKLPLQPRFQINQHKVIKNTPPKPQIKKSNQKFFKLIEKRTGSQARVSSQQNSKKASQNSSLRMIPLPNQQKLKLKCKADIKQEYREYQKNSDNVKVRKVNSACESQRPKMPHLTPVVHFPQIKRCQSQQKNPMNETFCIKKKGDVLIGTPRTLIFK